MAMDTEEMIRAQPIDGVVLLANCDKTTPAQLMGAASADVPAIMLTGGPTLNGRWRGRTSAPAPIAAATGPSTAPGRSATRRSARSRTSLFRCARPLHGDGHRQHDGIDRRGHRHDASRRRRHPRPRLRPTSPRRGDRPPHRCDGRARTSGRPDHDPRRDSRTRSASASRSAVRPTPSSTSPPSPAALGIDLPLDDLGPRSAAKRPIIATSGPPAHSRWRSSTRPAASRAVMKELLPLLNGDALTVTGKTVAENSATSPEYAAPRRHCAARRAVRAGRRHGRPARQPRPERRRSSSTPPPLRVCSSTAAAPSSSLRRGHDAPHQRPRARRDAEDSCWCCRTPGRSAAPGMPEAGMIPIPAETPRRRASATWSASPTRA